MKCRCLFAFALAGLLCGGLALASGRALAAAGGLPKSRRAPLLVVASGTGAMRESFDKAMATGMTDKLTKPAGFKVPCETIASNGSANRESP